MGYSYLQKPHSEGGREFKVSPICLRTAVSEASFGIYLIHHLIINLSGSSLLSMLIYAQIDIAILFDLLLN